MKLERLFKILSKVVGSGHPVVFVTPDGKEWGVDSVMALQQFSDDESKDSYKTQLILKGAGGEK